MGASTALVSYAEPKPVAESAATAPASKAVYVGGLPQGATEEALKELFTKYGEVCKLQYNSIEHHRLVLASPHLALTTHCERSMPESAECVCICLGM